MYIIPIVKVPYPQRRILGKKGKKLQNWWRGCAQAAQLAKENKIRGPKVLVLSGFHLLGSEKSESEIYQEALSELGTESCPIPDIFDTIGQVQAVLKLREIAAEKDEDVILICDILQYPRIRWMCRGRKFQYRVVIGLPNVQEFFTDLILIPLFPIIDLIGLRDRFQERLVARRKAGRL